MPEASDYDGENDEAEYEDGVLQSSLEAENATESRQQSPQESKRGASLNGTGQDDDEASVSIPPCFTFGPGDDGNFTIRNFTITGKYAWPFKRSAPLQSTPITANQPLNDSSEEEFSDEDFAPHTDTPPLLETTVSNSGNATSPSAGKSRLSYGPISPSITNLNQISLRS